MPAHEAQQPRQHPGRAGEPAPRGADRPGRRPPGPRRRRAHVGDPMSAGLPRVLTDDLVRAALQEDLGRAGDVTTTAIARPGQPASGDLVAREAGVVAGLDLAIRAFELLDPALAASGTRPDGTRVAPGDVLAHVSGAARALLGAERVSLNLCSHLSGVATATAELVEAVRGTSCRITCTRKTTPGLRAVEKAAVRAGGGSNHRFGLEIGRAHV